MPEELKPVLRRQMEVYAGFLEYTDHHVGRLIDALERPRGPRRHARLLHHRRQRRLGRGHAQRHLQRDDQLQRRRRARDAGVHDRAARRLRRRRTPTTTTRSAGRTRCARPTSGPSRSPRTGAARATARSSTGRRASRPRARSARSSATSSTSRRPSSRPPGCPEPTFVHGVQQKPLRGRQHGLLLRRCRRPPSATDAVLRDVRQPRHLPRGLDRGHPARHAVGARRRSRSRPSTTTSGSSTTRTTDWTQASDLSQEQPEKLAELQRLFLIEATKYNVLPLDDRVAERLMPDVAGRPDADHRATARSSSAAWAACPRARSSASRTSRTPSRPRSRFPTAAPQGVIIAQGGSIGGWSLYAEGRQAAVLLQPARPPALLRRRRHARCRRARTRCGWSSTTTAAGWARAARSRSTSTAPRSARGDVAATAAMIFSADDTLRRRARGRRARGRGLPGPATRSPARSTGSRSTSATPPTDADHLIDPDERLRVAMARQ